MQFLSKSALSVMVAGLVFAPVAVPVTHALSLRDADKTVTGLYQDAKTAYMNAVSVYENARDDYQTAKLKYQKSKNATNLNAAVVAGRNFLLKSDEAALEYVQLLQTKVNEMRGIDEATRENISAELQTQIDWLIATQTDIKSAEDRDALVSIASTVSDYWDGIRASAKKYTGNVLAARVNYVIDSMETLSAKIQDKIDVVKADGQDTTELEALLAEFEADIATANAEYDKAVSKFNEIGTLSTSDALFREGRGFLTNADKALRDAHKTLTDIVKALRGIRLSNVLISGTGRLYAEGDGTAVLDGNGEMTGSVSDDNSGTVTVIDRAGDVSIDTDGVGERKETTNAAGDAVITITGVGSVTVSGTDMKATLKGNALDLLATGTGDAELTGTGTFRTSKNGKKYDFSATPVTISITSH